MGVTLVLQANNHHFRQFGKNSGDDVMKEGRARYQQENHRLLDVWFLQFQNAWRFWGHLVKDLTAIRNMGMSSRHADQELEGDVSQRWACEEHEKSRTKAKGLVEMLLTLLTVWLSTVKSVLPGLKGHSHRKKPLTQFIQYNSKFCQILGNIWKVFIKFSRSSFLNDLKQEQT